MSENKPTLEEDIERVLARIESAQGGYRSTFSLRSDLARRMHNIGEQYVPQDIQVVNQNSPLSERIKAIYPVIHRTFGAFIDTGEDDAYANVQNVNVGRFRKKFILGVNDNAAPVLGKNYIDAGVSIALWEGSDLCYHIFRFRPEWERLDSSYNVHTAKQRERGVFILDNEFIDIRSPYFKIDCMSLPEFVEALRTGDSEPALRQATLDHLLSLPNILGSYLDRKEDGRI